MYRGGGGCHLIGTFQPIIKFGRAPVSPPRPPYLAPPLSFPLPSGYYNPAPHSLYNATSLVVPCTAPLFLTPTFLLAVTVLASHNYLRVR
jgi:hypothetical protein